ncbi:hypothetical protein Q5752_002857 [Cryptotrichosporon argae]
MTKPPRHVAIAIVFCAQTHRVLMVTSRKHPQLWLMPKGGIEDGETAGQAAVRESFEEAGTPSDLFVPDDADELLTVDVPASPSQKRGSVWHVHAVMVEREEDLLENWLERHERRREWLAPVDALARIGEWYSDPSAAAEIEVVPSRPPTPRSAASTQPDVSGYSAAGSAISISSSTGNKNDAKGGAMERALRTFTGVYGWDKQG